MSLPILFYGDVGGTGDVYGPDLGMESLFGSSSFATRADMIFIWQSHLGICVGGRRDQTHEAVKLAMKRLILSNSDPDGCAFPKESVLIEPPHLRQDKSRPGDVYTMGNGLHRKDSVMDIVIS